jgi:hypothetical protein
MIIAQLGLKVQARGQSPFYPYGSDVRRRMRPNLSMLGYEKAKWAVPLPGRAIRSNLLWNKEYKSISASIPTASMRRFAPRT